MSLRLFIDQCVPTEISEILRANRHQVTLLRELLPIRSPDNVVIAKAQALGAILLSLDGDFADIVAYPPSNYCGILALQLQNHPEVIPQLMARLLSFLASNPDQSFYDGKLIIVEVHRVRVRQ